MELVHALLDLYAYVHPMERDESCSLIVSRDQYHEKQCNSTEAINLYSGLSFFRADQRKERIDVTVLKKIMTKRNVIIFSTVSMTII